MKILLADNATGYAAAVVTLTEKANRIQAALDAYLALGLAVVPTTADLPDLWYKSKLFLERMLTGGQPVTLSGGLAVEPGKVFDLLQKPVGTDAFLDKVEALRIGDAPGSWTHPGIDISQFELNGGTVQARQATLTSLRETYRLYATTQRQKDEWDALQTIVGALEIIRQNGRFGEIFEAPEYLKKALVSAGRADRFSQVRADAAYVLASL